MKKSIKKLNIYTTNKEVFLNYKELKRKLEDYVLNVLIDKTGFNSIIEKSIIIINNITNLIINDLKPLDRTFLKNKLNRLEDIKNDLYILKQNLNSKLIPINDIKYYKDNLNINVINIKLICSFFYKHTNIILTKKDNYIDIYFNDLSMNTINLVEKN